MTGRFIATFATAMAAAACGAFTDPATRLAHDLEDAASQLPAGDGARLAWVHETPSQSGQCDGPYRAQLDEVGAIIIWCRGPGGSTVSSHSTSSHRRLVGTPRTFIVDKPAASPLRILLERRRGRAVIVAVS